MLVYAWIMPFTSCLRAMVKVLTFFTFGNVFKMCELAIVRVKWKKFTAAIVMQCGESTLWQSRIFNKLPPSQQLSWSVPDKIAPPPGSSHCHCGTWLPFVPRRFLRCIVPQVWRADSTSLLWAVTLYLLIMLCAVKRVPSPHCITMRPGTYTKQPLEGSVPKHLHWTWPTTTHWWSILTAHSQYWQRGTGRHKSEMLQVTFSY